MSSRSLRNIDNATLNREAYSNNLTQLKIENLGEFNHIQEQVNYLYSSIDITGGGVGPVADVVNSINTISTELTAIQENQVSLNAKMVQIEQDISSIYVLNTQVELANQDNIYVDASDITILVDKTFSGGLQFSGISDVSGGGTSGFLRSDASANIYYGALVNSDIVGNANIPQSKLATISSAGKVSNSALSSTPLPVPFSIAQRNATGDVYDFPQDQGTANFKVATCGFVVSETQRLIDGASDTLNTLSELANALGNDPQFFQNVEDALSTKAPVANASFSGTASISKNILVSSLNTSGGIIRNDSSGNLYSYVGEVSGNDFSQVVFKNSDLDTISSVGKVANSATTASYIDTPNTIVLRDDDGNVYGNNVVDSLYCAFQDKDPSWNTWGNVPLSKTCAYGLNVIAPYIQNANDHLYFNVFPNAGIAWSPQLKLAVLTTRTTSDPNKIQYSTDLIHWKSSQVNDIYAYNEIMWAPEVGLFIAYGNSILYSNDGIHWSKDGVFIPNTNPITSMCWAPQIGVFVAVSNTGSNNRVMYSVDGKVWTQSTFNNANNWENVCWSPELGLFVAVSTNGVGSWSITSNDGATWTLGSGLVGYGANGISWSPELGLFIATPVFSSTTIYISRDGKTWNEYTKKADQLAIGYKPLWCKELKAFICGFSNSHGISFNGIDWIMNLSLGGDVRPNNPVYFIPEYGIVYNTIGEQTGVHEGGMTRTQNNYGYPTTQSLFNGPLANIDENGAMYFRQLYFNTTASFSQDISTCGINAVSSISSDANVVATSIIYRSGSPSLGHVLTCVNKNASANTKWSLPVGSRVSLTNFQGGFWVNASESGTIREMGSIVLPFGRWIIYYCISVKPDSGSGTITKLNAGISETSASSSYISGSLYKDDFAKTMNGGYNSMFVPRSFTIYQPNENGKTYYLNVQLYFNGELSNVRLSSESYLYAVKLQ